MTYFDMKGTTRGAIIDILLEKLGSKVEPWEAEEIADEIVEEIFNEFREMLET